MSEPLPTDVTESDSLFLVAHDPIRYVSGEKTKRHIALVNGEPSAVTEITARCIVTGDIKTYVQRGLTSDPGVHVYGSFTTASGTVGGMTFKFPEAEGIVKTVRSRRVNEAGFWEADITVETRSATIEEAT